MVTKITVEFDEDVAEYLHAECQRQNEPVHRIVNQFVRKVMPDKTPAESPSKRFRIKPFDLEFAPEFAGMTPKEILAALDDEYYAKKLAGGTDAFNARNEPE